jgi:hypothetical protein
VAGVAIREEEGRAAPGFIHKVVATFHNHVRDRDIYLSLFLRKNLGDA